ncbi:hypothetical protein [Desulfobacca acetoxidans]|uniref:Lipoprotein n=1 Tax=Desulfobacca acetoxidans (strain ATCC 700848 / DSM 11109 / ASRB2) TaxID=880072 RepID=F2NJF0_DESAR|nr:hypothetical protein [Desulfobacca acetoxidans]AEB09462.1 hypothetical protein Desac_1611 [Desulfobacca acetoxidans DSM 11109]
MYRFSLLFLICGCLWGCTSNLAVNNSTNISTDANGFAVGQYSDSRSGQISAPSSFWLGGGGGGGGGSGLGLGTIIAGGSSGQVETQGNPLPFARAVAMINYSRRLDTVSCDDLYGGVREYRFSDAPLKKKGYQPFGHQVE